MRVPPGGREEQPLFHFDCAYLDTEVYVKWATGKNIENLAETKTV